MGKTVPSRINNHVPERSQYKTQVFSYTNQKTLLYASEMEVSQKFECKV